jgi:hypothetical protein
MVAAMNPPTALQRLGLTREAVQAMAWRQQVQVRAAEPAPTPRAYRSPRLVNTQYLDGEQQRAKKAVLHANEAVIIGMVMQGFTVFQIALSFGVTDQAVRNRMKDFGVIPPDPSIRDRRAPVYREIAKHEILRVEIDNYHPQRKASARKFDPRQLFLPGIN